MTGQIDKLAPRAGLPSQAAPPAPPAPAGPSGDCAAEIVALFAATRARTEALCAGLSPEDCQVQSASFASPVKWHLAHTTWFFDHFILGPRRLATGAGPLHHHLYNSYYHTAGAMTPRGDRGLVSRPSLAEVLQWRARVDESMATLVESCGDDSGLLFLARLGLEHERQHQELILMDIKHHFYRSECRPAYAADLPEPPAATREPLSFIEFAGGVCSFGRQPVSATEMLVADDPAGFCYDNETPQHEALLPAFAIADRLVSCGEYLEFIEDGGYRRVELWFADAWEWLAREGIEAPLYWRRGEDGWMQHTLAGTRPLRPELPLSHISYYEASAFAAWAGKRLPTEFELEHVCAQEFAAGGHAGGNFMESGHLEPVCDGRFCGNLWQWTSSAYGPYPGFRPLAGSIGEYNGKFMVNQQALRGGSCTTPKGHFHPSRRNFFYPHERWMYSGMRLCLLG